MKGISPSPGGGIDAPVLEIFLYYYLPFTDIVSVHFFRGSAGWAGHSFPVSANRKYLFTAWFCCV